MKRRSSTRGKPALDLVEEAVHVLRQTPLRLLLAYYVGAVPFVLGLLHFWADMSCGAFAGRHCAAAALGMTALFLWMKTWHAIFAAGLRERIGAGSAGQWNWRRWLRLVAVQAILQPSKLFLLPAALITMLPFAWTLAFYENITALGDGGTLEVRRLIRRAAGQANIWPGQNHLLVGILFLLGVTVWLNTAIALFTLPQLLKLFLGVETAFTRGGVLSLFNSTFLAATFALAYLALDPLVKTIYPLRCFYGEARHDGADLLADLAMIRSNGKMLAIAAVIIFVLLPLTTLAAPTTLPPGQPVSSARAPATISATKLEDALKQTLARDKYAWRLPREQLPETDGPVKGWLRAVFQSLAETLVKWARAIRDVVRDAVDWLRKIFKTEPESVESSNNQGIDWMFMLRGFAYVLLALAAAALALLLWRVGRQGWKKRAVIVAEILPARPDMTDENVTANQLPEDGWLKLARELRDNGELRLSLRALYLASLANLSKREVISLARFKSNRDYEREVARRARALPELRAAFSQNVTTFDRAWYGLHEVTAEALKQFQGNLERIRAC